MFSFAAKKATIGATLLPPQPLSRVSSTAGFALHATGFEQRPAIAQGIAQCIAYWSWVDTQISRLYVILLGGNEEMATSAYNALESAKAKRDAILSLALSHLKAEDYRIVAALLRYVKSQQSTRDRIAHWMWGLPSDDLPDAMVLVDPKFLISQHARIKSEFRTLGRNTYDTVSIPRDEVFVYRPDDLARDAEEFSGLAELVNKVAGLCYGGFQNSARDQRYDELTKDARLAKYLSP